MIRRTSWAVWRLGLIAVLATGAAGVFATGAPADPANTVRLSIHPGGGPQRSGAPQTIEVRAMLPNGDGVDGVNIDLELTEGPGDDDVGTAGDTPQQPDMSCTSSAGGPGWAASCTVTYTELDNSSGADAVLAWIDQDGIDATVEADLGEGENSGPGGVSSCRVGTSGGGHGPEPDATDCAEKRWVAREPAVLDLTPESITGVPGDSAALRASVFDQFGDPFPYRAEVRFELLAGSVHDGGAGPDLGTCTTAADGSCAVTLATRLAGLDRVCAYLADAAGCIEPADAPERADGTDVGVYTWASPPAPPQSGGSPPPAPVPPPKEDPAPKPPRDEDRKPDRGGGGSHDGDDGGAGGGSVAEPPSAGSGSPDAGGALSGADGGGDGGAIAPHRSAATGSDHRRPIATTESRPESRSARGDRPGGAANSVSSLTPSRSSHARPRSDHEDGPKLAARLSKAALATAETFSFPLILVVLVGLFLAIQSRIDRRDPKLRLAPIDAKHDLVPFA